MATYSISELEKLSGIKAHTIRIWEKRYGIIEPARSHTNIRKYSDNDLKRLLNMAFLNRHGFRISKIAELEGNEVVEKIKILSSHLSDSESKINLLITSMIDLDECRFQHYMNSFIKSDGFEKAVTSIVYPFLERIGILWQTGSIHPAHEHFVSNLIRQKLIVAIDKLEVDLSSDVKVFLFFLPEGELHEIGLLFYHYLVKKAGFKTIYLGQSVPLPDLQMIAEKYPVDYLFISVTSVLPENEFKDYLKKIREIFSNQTIFITGRRAVEKPVNIKNSKTIRLPSEMEGILGKIKM